MRFAFAEEMKASEARASRWSMTLDGSAYPLELVMDGDRPLLVGPWTDNSRLLTGGGRASFSILRDGRPFTLTDYTGSRPRSPFGLDIDGRTDGGAAYSKR